VVKEAERCALNKYKKKGKFLLSYKDKWLLNLETRSCNCGGFIKSAICGHILGYKYRNNDLDQQFWLGPKFSLTGNKFQTNIKRERKKIDENNGKEKVPRKLEKMPKY